MRQRKGLKKGIALLPNLLTTANMFCGFYSIVKSLQGQFEFAAWLVVLAMFFDFLDGRVARMTNTASDFGVEFDSLSDLTTFCLAPAILGYQWILFDLHRIGIAGCFLFFLCGALRLARFNVQSGDVEKTNFQGLPSPTAGGVLVTFTVFYNHVIGPVVPGDHVRFIFLGLTVALGLLMVSHVEYRSFKKVNKTSFVFMVFLVAVAAILAAQPEVMFFVVGMTYVLIGLVMWLWKSPQKIRGFTDLLARIYNNRRENFILEEDED